jgi:RNA polymerase sigma-70 factor (ECF subfamily)
MSNDRNESLSSFFQQCEPELRGFLSRRLGPHAADDVVQEAYLRLLQYPCLDAVQNLRAFLFKTASNLMVDWMRQDQARAKHIQADVDLEILSIATPDPEAVADGALQLGRFWDAVGELPELCRHAFLLNRIDGLTHAEIAKRLGISKKTVERYILKAFDHCYARLGRAHASSARP